MLSNLRAEMIRYNVSIAKIAQVIGKTDRSVRDKVNGKYEFSVPEAGLIRDTFFPGMSLEYLFAKSKNN